VSSGQEHVRFSWEPILDGCGRPLSAARGAITRGNRERHSTPPADHVATSSDQKQITRNKDPLENRNPDGVAQVASLTTCASRACRPPSTSARRDDFLQAC